MFVEFIFWNITSCSWQDRSSHMLDKLPHHSCSVHHQPKAIVVLRYLDDWKWSSHHSYNTQIQMIQNLKKQLVKALRHRIYVPLWASVSFSKSASISAFSTSCPNTKWWKKENVIKNQPNLIIVEANDKMYIGMHSCINEFAFSLD